ncbi:MAG: hypothetical protein AAFY78_03920 [Cyanobacteria bacterium J06648_16]
MTFYAHDIATEAQLRTRYRVMGLQNRRSQPSCSNVATRQKLKAAEQGY